VERFPGRSTGRDTTALTAKSVVHLIVCVNTFVTFDVQTAVLLKIRVFWDVKPTHLSQDRSIFIFEVKQCQKSDCLTLKMIALWSSETSIAIYRSKQRSVLEGFKYFQTNVLPNRSFFFILTAAPLVLLSKLSMIGKVKNHRVQCSESPVKGPCCVSSVHRPLGPPADSAAQRLLLCQFAVSLSARGSFNVLQLGFGFYNRFPRRCSVPQIKSRGPLCNSPCGRKNGFQPERTHNEVSYSVRSKASCAMGSARARSMPRMLLVNLSPVTAYNVRVLRIIFKYVFKLFHFVSQTHVTM
jgi:hypothetical protein